MTNEPPWAALAVPAPQTFAVGAWPPLLWQVGSALEPNFEHWDTSVAQSLHAARGAHGHTLWVARAGPGKAGVSWDWVELTAGVVAMVNPMALTTNLRLLSPEGEALPPSQVLQYLHRHVYALPWQQQVQRALQEAA